MGLADPSSRIAPVVRCNDKGSTRRFRTNRDATMRSPCRKRVVLAAGALRAARAVDTLAPLRLISGAHDTTRWTTSHPHV